MLTKINMETKTHVNKQTSTCKQKHMLTNKHQHANKNTWKQKHMLTKKTHVNKQNPLLFILEVCAKQLNVL